MSAWSLASHQARYDTRIFLRNPRARVFTLALPVVLFLILVSIFRQGTITAGGQTISLAAYYVPHIAAMAIVGAALSNLLITVVGKRESGVLKRRRATPAPAWVLIAGDAFTSVMSALVIVAVLIAIGWVFFGVDISAAGIGIAAGVCVLGAAPFCCMAYGLSSVVGSVEAAGPAVQLSSLPVYFISGIYVPDNSLPAWLQHIGSFLPVRPLALSLQYALDPATNGGGRVAPGQLLVIAAWGAVGLIVALRRFSWAPRQD